MVSAKSGAMDRLSMFGRRLIPRNGYCVGGDDLFDVRLSPEALDRLAGEQTMRAGDRDPLDLPLAQLVQHLDDCAAVGDLVVDDDHVLPVDVTDDGVDHDVVVADPLLAAGGHRQPRASGRSGDAAFALPRSGETTTVFFRRRPRKWWANTSSAFR